MVDDPLERKIAFLKPIHCECGGLLLRRISDVNLMTDRYDSGVPVYEDYNEEGYLESMLVKCKECERKYIMEAD